LVHQNNKWTVGAVTIWAFEGRPNIGPFSAVGPWENCLPCLFIRFLPLCHNTKLEHIFPPVFPEALGGRNRLPLPTQKIVRAVKRNGPPGYVFPRGPKEGVLGPS